MSIKSEGWSEDQNRVPARERWPLEGFSGQVRCGPQAGTWVLIEPVVDPLTRSITEYVFVSPVHQLFDENGQHVIDDGVMADARSTVDWLLDDATRRLGIQWSLDPADLERDFREKH